MPSDARSWKDGLEQVVISAGIMADKKGSNFCEFQQLRVQRKRQTAAARDTSNPSLQQREASIPATVADISTVSNECIVARCDETCFE